MTDFVKGQPWSIPTIYNDVVYRSRFEADTAAKLDRDGFVWRYESISFKLKSGLHYWPDFLVTAQPDGTRCRMWIECRGYVTDVGERQILEFAAQLKPGESFGVFRPGREPVWYPRSVATLIEDLAYLVEPRDFRADLCSLCGASYRVVGRMLCSECIHTTEGTVTDWQDDPESRRAPTV